MFKLGDRVYDKCLALRGEVIFADEKFDKDTPVVAIFHNGCLFKYTRDGRMSRDDEVQLVHDLSETHNEDEAVGPADELDAPDYYKTAGMQPIDLMKKLMTSDEYEGFLWGNIIKYAYRYGRKDDKAGTARKIEYYAKRLAESQGEGE